MGSLCGPSTNTTTTVNTPPPQVLSNYQDLVERAKVLGTQLQAGPSQQAAALTQQQLGGINNVDLTTSMAAPYFNAGLGGMASGFGTVSGALGYVPQGAATLQGALAYIPQGAAALGKASDYYSQGAGMASAGAAPIHQMQFSKDAVDMYMSPYTANVIDTTLKNIQHQNMVQQNALRGTGILGGNAFGGDRAGVAAAELGRGQAAVSDQTIATLWDKNYSQALNEFNVQQAVDLNAQQNNMARMLQAAGLYGQFGQGEGQLGSQYAQLASTQGQLANVYNNLASTQGNLGLQQANIGNQVAMLGPAVTQTALNSANAQIAAGTVAQQTYQNQLNAAWNAYLLQLGVPSYNLLSGAVQGTGAASGGTSQTQSPGPSTLSQLAGLGVAGIGLYNLSDEREKENIKQIGEMYDGQPLYKYNFKGSPKTEVGLLAQDVEQDNPEAVREFNGRKAVNYDTATSEAADRGHYADGGGVEDYGDENNDDSGIGSRLEIAAANALAREFAENISANDHAARLMAGAGYASGGYTGNDPLSGAGGMGGNMGGYGTTGGNTGGYGNTGNYTGAYNDTAVEDNTNYRFVNPTTPGYGGPTPNNGGGYGAGSPGYTWQLGVKYDESPGETWQQFAASADPLWASAAGVTPLVNRPAPYGNSGRSHEGNYTPPPSTPPPTEGPPQPPPGDGTPLPPDPDPYVPPAATPRPPLPPEHRNHPYYQASQVATQPGRYAEGGSTSGETNTMPNRFADLRAMFANNNANGSGLAQLQALRDRFANMGGEGGGGGGGGGFAGLQALRDQLAGLGHQAWGGQNGGGQGWGGQGGGGQGWGSQAWRDRLTAAGWTPPATTPTPTPDPTPTPTETPTTPTFTPTPEQIAATQTAAEEAAANNVELPPPPTNRSHERGGDPAPGGRGGRGGGGDPAPGGRGGRGGNTQAAPVYTYPGQTWQEYAAITDPLWGRAAGMTPDSPWYQPPAPAPQQIYDNGARGYPAPGYDPGPGYAYYGEIPSRPDYNPGSGYAYYGEIPSRPDYNPATDGYGGFYPAEIGVTGRYDQTSGGYPVGASWYPTDASHYNNPAYAASVAPRRYASGGYVDDIPDPFLSNYSDQVSGIKSLAALRRAGMSPQGRGGTMPRMGIPTGSPNTPKQTSESLADQLRKIGRPKDPKDRITFGKLFGGTSSEDPLDLSSPETGATGGRMGMNNLVNNIMLRRQLGYARGGAAGPVDGDTYGIGDHVKKKFRPDFL